jgi:hypothetical protein
VSATLIVERDDATVLSGSVVLPDGARGTLIQLPGRFRLDVQAHADTLRTSVRNLAGGSASLRGSGYAGPVFVEAWHDDLRPTRYDLTVDLENGREAHEVNVLIGAVRDTATGVTTFTAQALVEPA